MTVKIFAGSIVYGKSGTPLKVDRIEGDILHVGERRIHRSAILRAVSPSPRESVVHSKGRIEVDLDKLDLDYQPTVTTPTWEPTTSVFDCNLKAGIPVIELLSNIL